MILFFSFSNFFQSDWVSCILMLSSTDLEDMYSISII